MGGSTNQRCSFALSFGKTCASFPSSLGASGLGFRSGQPTVTNMGNLDEELPGTKIN